MKRNAILWTAGIVVALVAYGWIEGVFRERNELRATLTEAESEYRDAAAQVDRLEARLASTRAAVPGAEQKGYRRGRSDGIAYACNAVYGNGPALDAWTHYALTDFGDIVGEIRAVVLVTIEQDPPYRFSRQDCRRLR